MPMPTKFVADNMREAAQYYSALDLATLVRSDLGTASFEELLDTFKAVQGFTRRVANCTWRGIPAPVLDTCLEKLTGLRQPIDRIRTFDVMRTANPSETRSRLVASFADAWADTYNGLSAHLCYAESVDSGADRYNDAMAKALAEAGAAKEGFKKDLADIRSALEGDKKRMTELVTHVEEMAKRSGVTNQAIHFKGLADDYRIGAVLWLVAAIASGVALYLYVRALHLPDTQNTTGLVAAIVPRLFTITLLSTALIFCLKNFSALAHNVVVNRHRQTALTTFKTFVSSTDDQGTKNAVLVQATQAIFAPHPTGYLKNDTETPQVNQVTEVVRAIAEKEKP